MDNDNYRTCQSCENYIGSIGENGYCKYYNHSINHPEKICSMYKVNEKNTSENRPLLSDNKTDDKKFGKITGQKFTLNQVIFICSTVSCVLLLILSFIFLGVTFEVLTEFSEISLIPKIIFSVFILLFVLSAVGAVFLLSQKYVAARWIIFILMICILALIFLKYDFVLLNFQTFLRKIILILFRVNI